MSTPAISIQNLTKIYPIPFKREKVTAVQDLSLTVEPGQVYGLLGLVEDPNFVTVDYSKSVQDIFREVAVTSIRTSGSKR